MTGKIPDNVGEWLAEVRRREPVTLTNTDRRLLLDWMRRPEVLEVWRQVLGEVEGQSERLKTLNMMDPQQAAEALRIQGTSMALTMIAETMWECARHES